MRIFKTVFLVLLAIVMLASCVVEKRRYMSGYHISWNERVKSEKSPESTIEPLAEDNSTQNFAPDLIENETEIVPESLHKIEKEIVADNSHSKPSGILTKERINKLSAPKKSTNNTFEQNETENVRKNKRNILIPIGSANTKITGVFSLIMSILAWLFILTAVGVIGSVTSILGTILLGVLSMGAALYGISGGISVLILTNAGDKNEGRILAMAALIIGIGYLVFIILSSAKS